MKREEDIKEEFEKKIMLEKKIHDVSFEIKRDIEKGHRVQKFCLDYLTGCKEKYVSLTGKNYDPHKIDQYTLPAPIFPTIQEHLR